MKKKTIEQHLASALNKAPIHLYEHIKNEPIHKMEEHDFITRQEPVKKQRNFLKVLVPIASIVAVFAVGLSIWYSQFVAIENAVFLDVNPSIEMAANKQDEVIELNGINQEGRNLAANIDYQDKSMQEVIQLILDALLEQNYVTTDNHTFLISVLNKNKTISVENSHQINQWIQEYLSNTDIQPVVLQQAVPNSDEIQSAAEQYNISSGKTAFIHNLIALNPNFTETELVNLSIQELIQLAREHDLDLNQIVDVDGEINEPVDEDESVDENKPADEDMPDASETPDVPESTEEPESDDSEDEDEPNENEPDEDESDENEEDTDEDDDEDNDFDDENDEDQDEDQDDDSDENH